MRAAAVIAALAFCGLPVAVAAQDATCEDQAEFMLANVPNLSAQTGFETASDYMESDTRLLLSMALYAGAAEALSGTSPDYGMSREFWLQSLVVSDGLVHCFLDDGDGYTGEQIATRDQFFSIYTDEIRNRFGAQAMVELGLFEDTQ